MGVGVTRRLRGRLPFDGQSKREVIEQVTEKTPDYNNKAFLRLSENVRDARGREA